MTNDNDIELTFTLDELLAAMTANDVQGNDGVTSAELVEMLQISEKTVRRRLYQLIQAGRVEHVKVRRMRLNGVLALTDGYRWIT